MRLNISRTFWRSLPADRSGNLSEDVSRQAGSSIHSKVIGPSSDSLINYVAASSKLPAGAFGKSGICVGTFLWAKKCFSSGPTRLVIVLEDTSLPEK